MSFADLGLSDPLLRAVTDSGYDIPTPIQKGAIPPVLMGKDLIGIAQTGTGKTASFVLPMIDILSEGRSRARMPRSLILEPTRELAAQVAENFVKYGKYHKLSMALLIGGVQMGDQVKALEKGVDVLIATPGRLMDLFGRGKIMLNGCDLLVIDEADRMLDMGFIPDIEEICSKLPKSRQTLLFSATMPPPIQKLAAKFLTDPKTVEVARPATANVNIDQRLVTVPNAAKKRDALRNILREDGFRNAIIFSNKKVTVRDLYTSLKRSGFSVGQIQGDMDQGSRIAEFDRFKKDEITILVASDVAARGLDVKGVSHVINFDVPWQPDDYIHRIGRTGRAGMKGIAYTLATREDSEAIAAIEKLTGFKINRVDSEGGSAAPSVDRAPAGEAAAPAEQEEAKAPRSRSRTRARPRAEATEAAPTDEAPVKTEAETKPQPKRASRSAEAKAEKKPEPAPAAAKAEPGPAPAPAPAAAIKPPEDIVEAWNGPVPSFLSLSAL
ncbi:MAG: DEAD/DEAH box helicase [Pseudomonadota bacterium]|nr:DEAD/DEAH box helicase [Pseudomonadota bacterium]